MFIGCITKHMEPYASFNIEKYTGNYRQEKLNDVWYMALP